MDIDLKKVTFDNSCRLSEGNGQLSYDGVVLGDFHRVSGYPARVTGLNGERGSFVNMADVVKFLVLAKNSVRLSINLFPKNYYILRLHEVMVTNDPTPGTPVTVSAKIHYNTKGSTGNSAASKPSASEMAEIDLDKGTIWTKKALVFENAAEIITALKEAVKEKL